MNTRDYPQTEFPTRAEVDAAEREPHAGWFPTGPAGSALDALLGAVNGKGKGVDNTQH